MDCKTHITYTLYGADENGNIYNLKTKRALKQSTYNGEKMVSIKKEDGNYIPKKSCEIVYECFNGKIKEGHIIKHLSGDNGDNKISNLSTVSIEEYCISKGEGVVSVDIETKAEKVYKNINSCAKALNIVPASVNRVLIGRQKTAISKIDGTKYTFKYL